METIDHWIDKKLAEIAEKLPNLVHQDPASFSCGFNAGYKQCLLELSRKLESLEEYDDI